MCNKEYHLSYLVTPVVRSRFVRLVFYVTQKQNVRNILRWHNTLYVYSDNSRLVDTLHFIYAHASYQYLRVNERNINMNGTVMPRWLSDSKWITVNLFPSMLRHRASIIWLKYKMHVPRYYQFYERWIEMCVKLVVTSINDRSNGRPVDKYAHSINIHFWILKVYSRFFTIRSEVSQASWGNLHVLNSPYSSRLKVKYEYFIFFENRLIFFLILTCNGKKYTQVNVYDLENVLRRI